MNREEKETFVRELIASVSARLFEQLERVPENWDGHELRHWIADQFQSETLRLAPARKKAYLRDKLYNYL